MRVGLLSDVHANLQALRTVLRRLEQERVDRLVCLGDIVGYGGDPEACVEIVRERASTCVIGNHDAAAVHPAVRRTFNAAAREAIEAHAAWLDASAVAFLAALPGDARLEDPSGQDLYLIHGTPGESYRFTYLTELVEAREAFEAFSERFGAVGHTHVPAVYERDRGSGGRARERGLPAAADGGAELAFARETRVLLNPGSVGQPRDGDPRAACMVLNLEAGEVRYLRLDYDVAAAQAAIRRRGLPEWLARRLSVGR